MSKSNYTNSITTSKYDGNSTAYIYGSISTKNSKIESYKKDISNLEEMLKLYDKCSNLNGAFHSDMVAEISLQIEHCKTCIKNLE